MNDQATKECIKNFHDYKISTKNMLAIFTVILKP
jgi:hypothetical protein